MHTLSAIPLSQRYRARKWYVFRMYVLRPPIFGFR
jgi:hypothetical protein